MKDLLSFTILIGVTWGLSALAAGPHVETFDSDYAGWTPTNNVTTTMTWTNGYARFRFNPTSAPPLGFEAGLLSSPASSGGSFAGDYFAVGTPMVGFDFYFETYPCPSIYIELVASDTNSIRMSYSTSGLASQTWYRLMSPLVDGWFPTGDVNAVAGDVIRVRIGVARPNIPITDAAAFRIDNVFLLSVPHASVMTESGGHLVTSWSSLRDGSSYTVEYSTNLLAGWSSITSFLAGASTHSTTNVISSPVQFHRLRAPVLAPL